MVEPVHGRLRWFEPNTSHQIKPQIRALFVPRSASKVRVRAEGFGMRRRMDVSARQSPAPGCGHESGPAGVVEQWLSFCARRRLWRVCADDDGGPLRVGAVFKNVACGSG